MLLLFFGFSKKLLKPTTMICFIITRALYSIVLYSLSCFSHCAQCHENIIVKERHRFRNTYLDCKVLFTLFGIFGIGRYHTKSLVTSVGNLVANGNVSKQWASS